MSSTDDLMVKLEEAIQNILVTNSALTKENERQADRIKELEFALKTSKKNIAILENTNKEMKIVNALSGNSEHKRLMKYKLNSLVKEVDMCIAEVKKKSF